MDYVMAGLLRSGIGLNTKEGKSKPMIFYADYSHIISLEVLIGLVCEKSKWIED